MTEENQDQKPKNKVLIKHDKELFPPVAHNTIVRPRFINVNGMGEMWITKVINEKGQIVEDYSNDRFFSVARKYIEFLNR